MHKNQFLLTTQPIDLPDWKVCKVEEYKLFVHPEMSFSQVQGKDCNIYLVGDVFSWKDPHLKNEDILGLMVGVSSFEELISQSDKLCGNFVFIYSDSNALKLFHDCGGQYEVFYDSEFGCIGSQAKLLKKACQLHCHTAKDPREYYDSAVFFSKKLFIGESTAWENIHHLLPNHYLDIRNKKRVRFFPMASIKENELNSVAEKVAAMLKGFIRAISLRSPVAIGVTGGFDSRLLFLASLDIDAAYYVLQGVHMDNNHPDIQLPQKLTKHYGKEFHVLEDAIVQPDDVDESYKLSIDFPRNLSYSLVHFSNHYLINGGISEVGRNCYGYFKRASGADIAYLLGYGKDSFVGSEYDRWLKADDSFKEFGCNYLDMLYWEERVGVWQAKASSEAYALGTKVFVPFNCRDLILELLSVDRKLRDYHLSELHKRITDVLAEGDTSITKLGYFSGNNPSKVRKIVALKRLGLYNIYRSFALKNRSLGIN